MSAGKRAVDVVDGALVWPLIVLSIPIVLTNLLQVGYNLADTFWVGRLGQEAVSALSYSWAIVFLVISLAAGFTVAGTVLVAQNKGAGHHGRIGLVAGQTISFVALLSIVFSVTGYLFAPHLLQAVGAAPGTPEYAISLDYTRTMFLGIPFVFGFFIFQALLQGWGDTRTPLYLMAFGVTLNVIADPFFILGFQDNVVFAWLGLESLESTLYSMTGFGGYGVQGAALATIATRGLGAAIGVWLLVGGYVGIHISLEDFVPKRETVRKIFRIGVPASVELSTLALSITFVTAIVALSGDEAVAGYGIGTRVTSMIVLPAFGLARGVETVVGQNLGARQPRRAVRGVYAASGLIVAGMLGMTAFVYLFSDAIVAVFITGDAAAVVGFGADYLRIVGATYVFLGVFYVVQGAFRGSGSTRTAMVFAVLGLIVLRVPPAYVLAEPLGLGATGVWIGVAAANVVMVVLAALFFLRGTWTGSVVEAGSGREGGVAANGGDR